MAKYKEWLEDDKLVLLESWARDGLTNEQIANNIGINVKTLYEWKNKESKISDVLKKGREVVDYEVENALLKRALGYTIQISEEKLDKDGFALEYTKGNRTSVQHLERPNAYSIHNHPSKYINEKGKGRVIAYNAPSSADLRNWALGRGKGTIVVASGNRTMYIMSKSNNFKAKEFTKAMKSAKTTGKYDSDVDKWLRANQKNYNYKYKRSKF